MKCEHKDGWVLKEEIVINPKFENDKIIAEFECNVIGCGKRKNFKFDITNVKEVEK